MVFVHISFVRTFTFAELARFEFNTCRIEDFISQLGAFLWDSPCEGMPVSSVGSGGLIFGKCGTPLRIVGVGGHVGDIWQWDAARAGGLHPGCSFCDANVGATAADVEHLLCVAAHL